MAKAIVALPKKPASKGLEAAFRIAAMAHDTVASLLATFQQLRQGAPGSPTDAQQDLLRAALAFASAGLDSTFKQAIRDALPAVINRREGARERFRIYIERKLRADDSMRARFLSNALSSPSPRDELMQGLIQDLVAESMQSADQVFGAAAHFDIATADICPDIAKLRRIFQARNQIVHEMDVNLKGRNRSRISRRYDDIIESVNEVLSVAFRLLAQIDLKLK